MRILFFLFCRCLVLLFQKIGIISVVYGGHFVASFFCIVHEFPLMIVEDVGWSFLFSSLY